MKKETKKDNMSKKCCKKMMIYWIISLFIVGIVFFKLGCYFSLNYAEKLYPDIREEMKMHWQQEKNKK